MLHFAIKKFRFERKRNPNSNNPTDEITKVKCNVPLGHPVARTRVPHAAGVSLLDPSTSPTVCTLSGLVRIPEPVYLG